MAPREQVVADITTLIITLAMFPELFRMICPRSEPIILENASSGDSVQRHTKTELEPKAIGEIPTITFGLMNVGDTAMGSAYGHCAKDMDSYEHCAQRTGKINVMAIQLKLNKNVRGFYALRADIGAQRVCCLGLCNDVCAARYECCSALCWRTEEGEFEYFAYDMCEEGAEPRTPQLSVCARMRFKM